MTPGWFIEIRTADKNPQVELSDVVTFPLLEGLSINFPLMLLARLAVATSWQGKGLGSGLLKDAMLRTVQAADIAGIRAMAVHAKDNDARAFYERFGFAQAPTDPYHLLILLKDVRALLKQQ